MEIKKLKERKEQERKEDIQMEVIGRLLSSQKLRNDLLRKLQLDDKYVKGTGLQFHHVIPSEVLSHYLNAYGEKPDNIESLIAEFDKGWNGVALLTRDDAVIHLGSHGFYNLFVEAILSTAKYSSSDDFINYAQKLAEWIKIVLNEELPRLRKEKREINMDEFTVHILIPQLDQQVKILQESQQ